MANPRPNPNVGNLRPVMTKEEARKRGMAGAKKSAETRRRRKTFQELAKWVLALPLKAGDVEEITALGEARGKNITVEEASIMAVATKAMGGDVRALEFLRDTAGERPAERVEVSGNVESAARDISAMIAAERARDDG